MVVVTASFMYDPSKIEPRWQKYWHKNKTFRAVVDKKRPKYYVLDMFPYPSGAGLHVGHPEGYTATDIICRYKRMNGLNVLHPMGWDAFGLPAENYAIKTKIHPKKTTDDAIIRFRQQIQAIGFSYDWDREINTSSPEYYRWTQWFFLFLYKNGLAYKKEAPVNWCESCKTVLANEQVVDGTCERCNNKVVQKYLSQWFFKITDFMEDTVHEGRKTNGLLTGLKKIDWPDSTLVAQENWIGRSEGLNFKMKVKGLNMEFEAYDSVPQTFRAQTFVIIAPEHPAIPKMVKGTEYEKPVLDFVEKVKRLKMTKKFDIETDMQGIFTGRYMDNPYGTGDLPIWISSFVVMDYGTGIVGCSAHDPRDFDFAKKYKIPLHPVMFPEDPKEAKKVRNLEYCFYKDPQGIMEEPEEFKGRRWGEVREDILKHVEKKGMAYRKTNYKVRDWLVSRQRYWGAPIPIIYCEKCGEMPVPEKDLPVLLPNDVDFMPTGESPLHYSKKFHQVKCPKCNKPARRESDTMDTFVCSSWYMYRFTDPFNKKEFAGKQALKDWCPVDLYVGGAEHTVMHLLYARFFAKALHRFGYTEFDEPFTRLRHQGLILGEDGEKMSKSRGNVINPDDVIKRYGADTLRLYEMFIGPFDAVKPWSTKSIEGSFRFLQKVWRIAEELEIVDEEPPEELNRLLHKSIKKVGEDIENFRFNTAISQMMILANEVMKGKTVSKELLEKFVLILAPFAPHICEEIWKQLGHKETLTYEKWPVYDPKLTIDSTFQLVFSVNGKLRGTKEVAVGIGEDEAVKAAMEDENVKRFIEEKEVIKKIYVPNKLVNIVIK